MINFGGGIRNLVLSHLPTSAPAGSFAYRSMRDGWCTKWHPNHSGSLTCSGWCFFQRKRKTNKNNRESNSRSRLTLSETNIVPEKWWLEVGRRSFPFGKTNFQGLCHVSFREWKTSHHPNLPRGWSPVHVCIWSYLTWGTQVAGTLDSVYHFLSFLSS